MAKKSRSWSELESDIQRHMRIAMEETVSTGYLKARENAVDFYSEGSPEFYEQTGHYGDAVDSDGVEGTGNNLSARIYMNPVNHGYSTGSFSAQEVWQAVEDHDAGVLGKSHIWENTEKDLEQILLESFCKIFKKL